MMKDVLKIYLPFAAWSLSVGVSMIAFAAWAEGSSWHFARLSTYQLFPLFGLLAFSLMWAHYIVAALHQYAGLNAERLRRYFETTSFVVLLAIVLHPGLLVWQLWRDGFGLPPESYLKHFVAPNLRWVALLGTVSLLIFLAYELRRWYSDRSWWKFVGYASDAAMVAIFYHGLRLGDQLQSDWFRAVWFVYGGMFVVALGYMYLCRYRARANTDL